MFLSSEFSFSWTGAGVGIAAVVIGFLLIVLGLTISFLLTMFVYNHVAPRGSVSIRVIATAAILFAVSIVVNFIGAKINGVSEQVFTSGSIISAFVNSIVSVLVAKFCTERFKGSTFAKCFKGALLYILIAVIIFAIMALIFGGAFVGGILPGAMQAHTM